MRLTHPMRLTDRSSVYWGLLPVIANSYPRAEGWLQGRLDDVLEGKADCFLARDAIGLRGVVIQTPKGRDRLKLSTIWVAPRARGQGLGKALVERCHETWHQRETREVWVTAGREAIESVERVLRPYGFVPSAYHPDRYREGHIETVLCWTVATDHCPAVAEEPSRVLPRPGPAVKRAAPGVGWDVSVPLRLCSRQPGDVGVSV